MGLFFKKSATLSQKIVASLFMAAVVGPFVLVFSHNFVAESSVSEFSLYASLLLTVLTIGILRYLYINEAWKPDPTWYNYSRFKKTSLMLFFPFFIFGLFWINLSISAPQLFTSVFGSNAVKLDTVVKHYLYSKKIWTCDYRLKPSSIDAIFFHYCISKDLYNQLPDTPIESELLIKKSALGYIVEDIRLFTNNANK